MRTDAPRNYVMRCSDLTGELRLSFSHAAVDAYLRMAAYFEHIADGVHRRGWSYGFNAIITRTGETLYRADASRAGYRVIARAESLASAFLELERDIDAIEWEKAQTP